MKRLVIVLLFTLSLFGFDPKGDIDAAKKEGKIAAFLIVKSGCPWCHKMMNLIEKDKDVSNLVKSKFYLVVLNKDDVKLPESMMTKFYPTIHFMDEKGDLIYQIIGYNEKDVFMSELKEIGVQR